MAMGGVASASSSLDAKTMPQNAFQGSLPFYIKAFLHHGCLNLSLLYQGCLNQGRVDFGRLPFRRLPLRRLIRISWVPFVSRTTSILNASPYLYKRVRPRPCVRPCVCPNVSICLSVCISEKQRFETNKKLRTVMIDYGKHLFARLGLLRRCPVRFSFAWLGFSFFALASFLIKIKFLSLS